MLRVLSQASLVLFLTTALGAAPGNKMTPDSNQGIPGQTQDDIKPIPAPDEGSYPAILSTTGLLAMSTLYSSDDRLLPDPES